MASRPRRLIKKLARPKFSGGGGGSSGGHGGGGGGPNENAVDVLIEIIDRQNEIAEEQSEREHEHESGHGSGSHGAGADAGGTKPCAESQAKMIKALKEGKLDLAKEWSKKYQACLARRRRLRTKRQ